MSEINLKQIVQQMDNLKDLQAKLKFDLKNIEAQIVALEAVLQTILEESNVSEMYFDKYRFGWVESSRRSFDQKLFSEAHPKLFEKFKTEKIIRKFDFKING